MSIASASRLDFELFSAPKNSESANSQVAESLLRDSWQNAQLVSNNQELRSNSPFQRIRESNRVTDASPESSAQPEKKVEWEKTLSDAYRRAAAEGKPMVLVFGSEWCGACQKLKETVLASKEFNDFQDKGVFVFADPDKDDRFGNIKQKMSELGIDSFPTMVIIDVPSMEERARVTGRWDKDIYIHKMKEAFKGKSDAPMPKKTSTETSLELL